MVRLIIASNRLHVTVSKKAGRIQYSESVGGLATALASCTQLSDFLWVGWPGIPEERLRGRERKEVAEALRARNCYPVNLTKNDIENYYYGFSNKTLWPLFHYFLTYTVPKSTFWASYKRVNKSFARVITRIAREDDIIWIHDYHLMLLPKYIREAMPDVPIGFFLHIPFPSYEVFRTLPWRREILEALLEADLIGFHTYDYVGHFLDSVSHLLGYGHQMGIVNTNKRIVKVDAFPISIDFERFQNYSREAKVEREIKKIRAEVGDRKIILSIDRLDYTKGILNRLEAFDAFLERYPRYREKVTLILAAVPSREGIEHYGELKKQIDQYIGQLNGRHGTIGWVPVWYMYRRLPSNTLVALYTIADVALITPIRDGMNLIAKEYVATKKDGRGVLVLSEFAGASKEMSEAIMVNVHSTDDMVEAIRKALEMPEKEQIKRMRMMQDRIRRYDVNRWASDFLEKLSLIKNMQAEMRVKDLTPGVVEEIKAQYHKAKKRLILLDYDGTLVPFALKPRKARPDYGVVKILRTLTQDKNNTVVIISGRERDILDRWFGKYRMGLVAEHGAWWKDIGGEWERIGPYDGGWKGHIKPVLEIYADRTPGSFVEEKEFSLVWHYRRVDPKFADMRVNELKSDLRHLTENLGVGIFDGSKVLEIKNRDINKGKAAEIWLNRGEWEFILAIGDDVTDEDTFRALPENAYTIKVGLGGTDARYRVKGVKEVRNMLREMVR